MELLAQHIESLIFVADHPVTFKDIKASLEATLETKFAKADLEKEITGLMEKYAADTFAFEIVEVAGGYQFLTKGVHHQVVSAYLKQTTKKRLSKSALETLAIIAYKQPVPKSEVEKIRGVSCDYAVQKLLEKELVSIMGRADTPGKPLLYGTSEKFMDYFGLKSLEDLPKLKDFKEPENTIGEKAPITEEAVVEGPPADSQPKE